MIKRLTNERWAAAVATLIARHGPVCHYCGRRVLTYEEAAQQWREAARTWTGDQWIWALRVREIYRLVGVLDHKIPISRGGTNDQLNLLLACSYCNGLKGALPYEEAVQFIRQRMAKQGSRFGLFASTQPR